MLSELTLRELKDEAKKLGLKGYSKYNANNRSELETMITLNKPFKCKYNHYECKINRSKDVEIEFNKI